MPMNFPPQQNGKIDAAAIRESQLPYEAGCVQPRILRSFPGSRLETHCCRGSHPPLIEVVSTAAGGSLGTSIGEKREASLKQYPVELQCYKVSSSVFPKHRPIRRNMRRSTNLTSAIFIAVQWQWPNRKVVPLCRSMKNYGKPNSGSSIMP